MTPQPPPTTTPTTRSLLARIAATFRIWANPSSRPLPRVEADVGAWVPVWFVTMLTAGLAVLGAALVARGPIGWLVIGGIMAALVLFPEGPAIGTYALAVGGLLLFSGAEPFEGRLFALVALVHLVAVLDSLVSGLPWRARLQLAATLGPLRRFASVQVAAQALALVGAALTGADLTMAWLPVIAAVGLAMLGWALNARLAAGGAPEHRIR